MLSGATFHARLRNCAKANLVVNRVWNQAPVSDVTLPIKERSPPPPPLEMREVAGRRT